VTQPSAQLIQATIDELRTHAPFDGMAREHLVYLASRLRLQYTSKDATLFIANQTVVNELFIVQRGRVVGVRDDLNGEEVASIDVGEMFPISALIGQRAATLSYRAASDVFCYLLDHDGFTHLMDVSLAFRNFCLRRLAHLLGVAAALGDTPRTGCDGAYDIDSRCAGDDERQTHRLSCDCG
jgi:CBS domain-containing protein